MLDIKGIKNLILCGVTTDVCVHSTMREANDNGFDCLLVEDCTAASEPHLHIGAVESVKAEGGIFGAVSNSRKILAGISGIHPERPDGSMLVLNGHPLEIKKEQSL
jgi:nicotinamidase-related amidase